MNVRIQAVAKAKHTLTHNIDLKTERDVSMSRITDIHVFYVQCARCRAHTETHIRCQNETTTECVRPTKRKKTTYIRMINSIRQCNTFQYDTVRIAPCLFSRSMCFTQCVCVRVGGCVRRRAFECIGALLMGCLLHLRSFGNHFFHFFPFHSIVCQVICKFVWQS